MEPDWHDKSILILGCGNILLGDDGFGPAVAQRLEADFTIPADVCVFDAGTSVREILFDTILSDKKPSKVVIVDAMDCGRKPGELFSPDIDSYPQVKLDDFSMHQIPTSNLLRELRDLCGVEVIVIACQVAGTCECVNPGLSSPVEAAVEHAAEVLAREHFQ
jgi:coenzyme F420 hydrogenase subunit delta